MWLAIFEDGNIKQIKADSSGQPSPMDQESIDAGILSIIKYEDGKFFDFYVDGKEWLELDTLEGN